MKMRFSDVFDIRENDSFSPKSKVHINGVTMTPGISFTRGMIFGGVDLASLADKDLEIERDVEVIIIKGHYP